MSKKTIKNESKSKKFLKITLWIFLGIIGIFTLFIIGSIALSPVFSKIEHDRFIALDKQMQIVYKNLKTASNGVDDWKYDKVCTAEMAGAWPTGRYFCKADILMKKTISSVDELNSLQSKYFSIIDQSDKFKMSNDSFVDISEYFGKKFVVSSFETKYKEVKSGISCKYVNILNQKTGPYHVIDDNDLHGSEIINNTGEVSMSLSCIDLSNDYWYKLDDLTASFTL